MSSATERSSSYRPEIQGIRAVAALLVASFHIWLGRVSGGVDVFFVMSGFLITHTLFGHLQKFNRIDPVRYATRLGRRLLPAALTVLVAVLIGMWLFLPTVLWENTTREIVAATLYYENWQLAVNAVDYLAQFDEHTVVQHFWAMSIQGQFYVIWLLLFMFIGMISQRFGVHRHTVAAAVFCTVFATSLSYSIWFTSVNQPFAYFHTGARAWEFALGGLAAVGLPHLNSKLNPTVKFAIGWAGLVGILSCGIIFQVSTLFPGYAALWPTTAALLILAAGSRGERWTAGRLLSLKPLVYLGDISYGIYLWHWPLLEFYRNIVGRTQIGWRGGVLIFFASILLAWLTKLLIEDPIQKAQSTSRLTPAVLKTVTATVIFLIIGTSMFTGSKIQAAINKDVMVTNQLDESGPPPGSRCFGAIALVAGKTICPMSINGQGIMPHPASTPLLEHSPCVEIERRKLMEACAFGAPAKSATKTILLVGDSHSQSWRVVVDELARHYNWHAIAISKVGCLPEIFPRTMNDGSAVEDCVSWNREMIAWVNEHPEIDTLFTIAAAGRAVQSPDGKSTDDMAVDGYLQEWAAMRTIRHVVVLRDSPRLARNVMSCVDKSLRTGRNPADTCKYPRKNAVKFDPAAAAARSGKAQAKVFVVDLTDNFCDDEYCYPVIGGLLGYRDEVHLNRIFARTLAPFAIEQVDKFFQENGLLSVGTSQ